MKLLRHTVPPPAGVFRHSAPLTIRWATSADAGALEALAELDEAGIPPAPLMVGYVGDEMWVAVSLSTGATIADPFRPSGQLAELVLQRGRHLTVSGPRPRFGLERLRRRAPAGAGVAARVGQGAG